MTQEIGDPSQPKVKRSCVSYGKDIGTMPDASGTRRLPGIAGGTQSQMRDIDHHGGDMSSSAVESPPRKKENGQTLGHGFGRRYSAKQSQSIDGR